MFYITRTDYTTGELKTIENRHTRMGFKTEKAALKWLTKNAWLFYEDIGGREPHRVLVEMKQGEEVIHVYMSMVEITSERFEFIGGEIAREDYAIQRSARLIEVTAATARRVREGADRFRALSEITAP